MSNGTHRKAFGGIFERVTLRRVAALLFFGVFGSGCLPENGGVVLRGIQPKTETQTQANVRCEAPPGVNANPQRIDEVAQLLNSLPRPVSLPCFIESLARPLRIHASSSRLSTQPAQGESSPRIFILKGNLIMTIVAAELFSDAMELGENYGGGDSIKGEIHFPVMAPLATADPFKLLTSSRGSACAFCHSGETAVTHPTAGVPALVSAIISPEPEFDVSLSRLIDEARSCDPSVEPTRCAILRAVVGDGDLVSGSF